MNTIREKILRIQRLQVLEQGRLDSMAAQFAVIESNLAKQRQQLSVLHTQVRLASISAGDDNVQKHCQRIVWVDHLDEQMKELQHRIQELEQRRHEMREGLLKQKAKVGGWETLTDRLNKTAAAELQRLESLVADDRFLNDRTVR